MYPIVRKETLADNIILMDIKAPRVVCLFLMQHRPVII